jgi:acyl-CoA thioester hydrolase
MSPDAPYTGRLERGEHRFAVRVYYEDTDAGGVVYYANYLRFLERARTDFLALLGIDLAASHAAGEGLYVVAEVNIRYRASARLNDALLITSRLQQIKGSSLVVQQAVSRDRAEVAVATVRVVFVGPDGRPRRQPAQWVSAFRAMTGE